VLDQLKELRQKASQELSRISDITELESWRVRYLGKKSELVKTLRSLSTLPLEERKVVGAYANEVKSSLENSLEQKNQSLREIKLATSPGKDSIDITLPGRPLPVGRLHPITQTLHEICDIFISMGFQIMEGPEVEWDSYNFEALNISEEHPARDNMSTSWVDFQTNKNSKCSFAPILPR